MFHLHGLQHDQWLVLADRIAHRNADFDDARRHWRGQVASASRRATLAGGVLDGERPGTLEPVTVAAPLDDAPGRPSRYEDALVVYVEAPVAAEVRQVARLNTI